MNPQTQAPQWNTEADFAASLKQKYPAYQSMDDKELVTKVLAKYPTYQSQIKQLSQPQTEEPAPAPGAEKKTSFAGKVIRGTLKPVLKTAMSLQNLGEAAAGQPITEEAHGDLANYVQEADGKPIQRVGHDFDPSQGFTKQNIGAIKDAAGTGAELASFAVGGGEGAQVAKGALKNTIEQSIKQGAKTGATSGALSGLGTSLQDNASAKDVLKSTVAGAATGLTAGGVLGAGGGMLAKGARGTAKAASATGEAIANPAKAVRSLTTKLSPTIKHIATDTENRPAMISHIQEAQTLAKEAQKGQGSASPIQNTANELFGKEGKVTTAIDKGRQAAGEKMNKALETKGVGDVPGDFSAHATQLEESPAWKRATKSYGSMTRADQNLYNEFKDEMYQFKKPMTLKETDDFIRNWQGRNSSDATLNKAITNTVHDVNEAAKSHADKLEESLGVEGHPYRESNDEYSRFIQPHKYLQEGRGEINRTTGRFPGAQKLLREVTHGEGDSKEMMDAVRQLGGEAGKKNGMSINDQAHLSTFIHDIYSGMEPKTALSNLSLGFSPIMTISRTAKNLLAKGTPDDIVKHLIDILNKK